MKLPRLLSIAVLGLALLAVALRSVVIKVEPGRAGVLNAEWTSGLIERDFGPGYHWDVGILHTWFLFDTTVQTLHMNRDIEHPTGGDDADSAGALQLKSRQGATITLDVTLKYRIKPGSAWRVLKAFGSSTRYKDKVRNTALDVLRASLGGLDAENFYDPAVRREVTVKMETDLGGQLEALHVELIGILIRDIQFDPGFEERIKKKTLASEEQELNKAQTLAEETRGKTNKIEAETEAKVLIIGQEREKTLRELQANNDKKVAQLTAEYKKRVQELQSDADLFRELQTAAATKLLREAEAKGQTLRRDALATAGGSTLIALETVKGLNLGTLLISTQATDPFDVDAVLRKLGMLPGR